MVERIDGVTYYTKEEFAALLRVPLKTVENWIIEFKIKYWQLPKTRIIRIPASELQRHLHGD